AAMKGTGKWTVQDAAEIGAPIPTISVSVDARQLSAAKAERVRASKILRGPKPADAKKTDRARLIANVRAALYSAKACSYAQGMNLLQMASRLRDWNLRLGELARIWQDGCIIRAQFLGRIKNAFERDPNLANLLLDSTFVDDLAARQEGWRELL